MCVSVCEPAKLGVKKKKSSIAGVPRPAAAVAASRCRCRRRRRCAHTSVTFCRRTGRRRTGRRHQIHTQQDRASAFHQTLFFFFFFLSSSPPLRVYFAPGWLRWRGWKCGGAERGGRVPPAPSTAPAEGAWRKQPFRGRDFLDVDARRLSALWRDQLDGVDAGSCWAGGVRRCSEYHGYPRRDKHHSRAQGKHSGKQKGAFIDSSTPIFAIVHAVYNALTSIIKIEHKFQLFGELLDLQVVSAVLFSYISAHSIIPSQQCRNPEQFISSQLHQKWMNK